MAAKAGKIATICIDWDPGRSIKSTPKNPRITAVHLWRPIFSLRKKIDSTVIITGAIKNTAVASA